MSTAKKFAWGCLAIVVLMFAAAYMGWNWISNNLNPTMNSQEIAEMQAAVIDIDIPSDFIPTYAMYTAEDKQDALFIYHQEDKRTLLSQLFIHQQQAEFDKDEAENRMANSFPGLEITRLEEHENEPKTFEVEVAFQPLPIVVTHEQGRTVEDAEITDVYSALFKYRDGHMAILLAGDPEFLNREQFVQLLRSIK